ncbi:MAG TPA: polysaccharide biosynthesis protein [Bacteroidota bacterium]|nr:polysaccharide biosynthesis protein [Bacteroidota bacterium]
MRALLPPFIRTRLFEGQARSVRAKQNIVGLFALRGVSMAINLLLVPMTLAYLDTTRYGIWTVMSSTIGWVSLMDVGLGNGLRNEVALAIAVGDRARARMVVSTTYACVASIVGGIIVLFLAVNPFLHWSAILNTPAAMEGELHRLAAVVFVFFSLRLLFGLIGTLLLADQKPARASLLDVLAAFLSLVGVTVLTRSGESSLFRLGFVVSLAAAAAPLAANFWYFARRYRDLIPSPRLVRPDHARRLVALGVKFFLLQIAGVVIFATSNIVIAQYFGASAVTPYNIAYRYYGVAMTAFAVLLTPFWSAFTDAYARGDTPWIAMTLRKLKAAWVLLAVGVAVMTLLAPVAYALWVGSAVTVPFLLSASMAAYTLVVAWSTIFAYFINGTGKIALQLRVAVLAACAVIPLAIFFASGLGLGSAGVMFAVCTALLPGCFLWPVQVHRIVTGTARGIWAR